MTDTPASQREGNGAVPWHSSLRFRLVAAAVAIELLLLAVLVGNSYRLVTDALELQTRSRLEALTPLLNATLAGYLFQRDHSEINGILKELVTSRVTDIRYMVVLDNQQRIVASIGPIDAAKVATLSIDTNVREALRDFVYDTRIDLALPGNAVGRVHFGLSLVGMASLRDNVLRQSVVIAGIELLLSLLLLCSVGWLITRHLTGLLGATRAIARGDYGQRIAIPGKDEIGLLAADFNVMTDSVQVRIVELQTSQEKLRTSESLLSRSQELGHIGSWSLDLTTKNLYWSDEVYRIFGCEPQEFVATYEAFLEFVHPDDRAALDESYSRSVSNGSDNYEIEHRILRRGTGELRHVHERCVHVRDATGTIIKSVGMVQDITERRRAEEALKKSQEAFRGYFEMGSLGMCVTSPEKGWLEVNERLCQMLGYSKAELTGLSWVALTHPDDLEADLHLFADVIAGKRDRYELEKRFIRKDGSVVYTTLSVSCQRKADGTVDHFLASLLDITARKQAEKALCRSEAQFTAAFNLNPLAANLATLGTGRIIEVNERYCQFFGYARDEVIGRTVPELKMWVEPALRDVLIQQVRKEGSVRDHEARLRRKDGSVREVLISVAIVDGLNTSEPVFLSILSDVTDRKSMETQLLQAQRIEAMGTLAGGIAHDLNNILSPILMVAGMLQGRLKDEQDQEMLEMLERESRRGGEIIKQLLVFSRGLEGQRAVMQPRYVLREVMTMLRETFPRELVLNHKWDAELWPISADQTQFHQAILNLCVNARDAMPDGGDLTLAATNIVLNAVDSGLPPTARPGSFVLIEVRDTGTGIPPEIKQRIFEPFFTTKPLGKGTGLGLSTVLGIIQNHGGFVTADSSIGQGSVFKTYWPAVPSGVVQDSASLATVASQGGGELILVVDDEPHVRDTMRIALQKNGYRVQLAINGEDALVQYHRLNGEVRLVVTDLMMPVMNGVVLIRRLREHAPQLPIIATSGLTDRDKRSELASLNVTELLMKPAGVMDLVAAVRRSMANVSAGSAG